MLYAFGYPLCLKLCWHNRPGPTYLGGAKKNIVFCKWFIREVKKNCKSLQKISLDKVLQQKEEAPIEIRVTHLAPYSI